MNNLLKQVIDENRKYTNYGQVASYIPELKNAKRSDLGICIIDKDNKIYTAGNYNTKFTIQSISKPIVLAMALMDNDWTTVFSKVGMEPSGDPFNSIMKFRKSFYYFIFTCIKTNNNITSSIKYLYTCNSFYLF